MQLDEVYSKTPVDWEPMNIYTEKFKIVAVPNFTEEYHNIEHRVIGNYYATVLGIYKVQNPFLYAKYSLRAYEYKQKGPYSVQCLFHDTPTENVRSIAEFNFDWRFGGRMRYGPGVYFSVSPTLAHKYAFKGESLYRSMFIVDVLVLNAQKAVGDIFLPDFGYDTVLAHNNKTYVKYFDCEYYPRYFVDYVSLR